MHILGHVNFCLATVMVLVVVAFVAGCTVAQVVSMLSR